MHLCMVWQRTIGGLAHLKDRDIEDAGKDNLTTARTDGCIAVGERVVAFPIHPLETLQPHKRGEGAAACGTRSAVAATRALIYPHRHLHTNHKQIHTSSADHQTIR